MTGSVRRIRIATYNIHKCRGLDQRTSTKRIADVIRQVNADVVALQEVLDVHDGRPEFDQARCLADALEGYHSAFGENRQLYGGAYGNMTLSRMPISFYHNYDLTWRHRERRGVLRTDFEIGGQVLHVFNVHLGTSFVERRHQGRRLVSEDVLHAEELGGLRVVVGDFNEWTRGLATRLMGSAFLAAVPRPWLRYRRTYPGIFPVLHLDHFYHDEAMTLVEVHVHRSRKALIASDHLPVVGEFDIEVSHSSQNRA
jgi:endonuclease/exonuclease/phosphatase family metal-dependent hydrolase